MPLTLAAAVLLLMLGQSSSDEGPRLNVVSPVTNGAPAGAAETQVTVDARRLDACLGELEGRQAAAIRTAFWDGATYEELARRMDVPLGTMKSLIRRGLIKLRECLER